MFLVRISAKKIGLTAPSKAKVIKPRSQFNVKVVKLVESRMPGVGSYSGRSLLPNLLKYFCLDKSHSVVA